MSADLGQAPNHNVAFARALLGELGRGGAHEVCLAPGSRSAPLAIAVADEPSLSCSVHIDERVAAFYALGLAKASRRPVVLICTSGTAAAHFYPAIIEAHYARVPLVVLTADRPPELREWGAGQTIQQAGLFGSHVRWFAEAPVPTTDLVRYARALGSRAAAVSQGSPPGPVHLNLPFREPLDPRAIREDREALADDELARLGRPTRPYTDVRRSRKIPSTALIGELATRIREVERGVISCGPMDAGPSFAEAVSALANAAGWPLIADGASGLRSGPATASLLGTADLLLRDPAFCQRFAPEFVLRLGDAPTSKALRLWLEAQPPREFLRVDPYASWHDPSHLSSEVVDADPEVLCRALASALGAPPAASNWLHQLRASDERAERALADALAAEDALFEPRAVRELAELLPADTLLYVASSMPIRDLDAFLPCSDQPLRVLCNRGANGIDGLVSSALGAAHASARPVMLLIGDVALAHDVSGLIASRRLPDSLTIVAFDNGGGGIFSYLPIASHGERVRFDEQFLTPPELDLPALCGAAGARYVEIQSYPALRAEVKESLSSSGVSLLHISVDRQANLEHVRMLAALAARAAGASAA